MALFVFGVHLDGAVEYAMLSADLLDGGDDGRREVVDRNFGDEDCLRLVDVPDSELDQADDAWHSLDVFADDLEVFFVRTAFHEDSRALLADRNRCEEYDDREEDCAERIKPHPFGFVVDDYCHQKDSHRLDQVALRSAYDYQERG